MWKKQNEGLVSGGRPDLRSTLAAASFEAVAVKQPRLKPEPVGVIPFVFLFCLPSHPPLSFFPPSPLSLLLSHPVALALCLLFRSPPMFANHFFPCQQVNCFVLPFPAFITLCKLSDMSSTGARQSTHCADAKIMRFGIINEDKLAVAVLLPARARLHYSLNLPEKMT